MTSLADGSDERYLRTMEHRAERTAREQADTGNLALFGSYAVVSVGGERLGILTDELREIVKSPPITRLPGAPPYLPGIVQIRGILLAVVDLALLFGMDKPSTGAFLGVVESERGRVGLMLDGIDGFREVYVADLAEGLEDGENSDRPVRGTTRDLLSLLDVARLLGDSRLVVRRVSQVT